MRSRWHFARCLRAAVPCAVTLACATILPGAEAIKPVPFNPLDPAIPRPVFEGANITLQAILRDASQSSYTVSWDINGDGVWDTTFTRNRDGTGDVRDLGVAVTVPNVVGDQGINAIVRAENPGAGITLYATYPLYVYDWTPPADPALWTDDHAELMRQIARDELLWQLHRSMDNFTGTSSSSAAIRGGFNESSTGRFGTTALYLHALGMNGRYPAYAPGTMNTYSLPVSPDWVSANNARWANDPYAEDATRLLNQLVNTATAAAIPPADEPSDGQVRIPGTSNSSGVFLNTGLGEQYATFNGYNGIHLAAVASVLPAMAGTPLQVGGGLAGQPYEWLVQEMVDYVGYQQLDAGGTGHGGWFQNNSRATGTYSAASIYVEPTIRAGYGLAIADTVAAPHGVIVGNIHKHAVANAVAQLKTAAGGAQYYGGEGSSNLLPAGGAIALCRWLGMDQMAIGDGSTPFAPVVALTAGQMRGVYDGYAAYAAAQWTTGGRTGTGGLADSLWQNGDYRCGDTTSLFGAPAQGSSYGMMWHAVGFGWPGSDPAVTLGFDWARSIQPYVARAVTRTASNYATFGQLQQTYAQSSSRTGSFAVPVWSTACAAIAASVPADVHLPVAVAEATPQTVVEGCAGGANGVVQLSAANSLHFDPEASLVTAEWDIDASNGLAWDSAQPADYTTTNLLALVAHTYMAHGTYTATLRVTDDGGHHATDTVQVTVLPMPNLSPTASPGGPYVLIEGDDLHLDASGSTDPNIPCGDTLSFSWDLDNDGVYTGGNDAAGDQPIIPWATVAGLFDYPADPSGTPGNPIVLRVADSLGVTDTQGTTVTIYSPVPTITGQVPISIAEDTSHTLALAQLSVFDADSTFPDDFTLAAGDGSNYTRNGLAIIPAPDFVGILTVPVTVSDGVHTSSPFDVLITVTNVNDPPVLDPVGDHTAVEGVELAFTCTASDPADDPPDNLAFSIDAAAATLGMAITPAGAFSWTPGTGHAGNQYGVTITVTDDGAPPLSDAETITITVQPAARVNDWETLDR